MRPTACFITGTDTGVGKTVLTALLARYLRERKIGVAALKPICSGGRDDARVLRAAVDGVLALDEINPWHFRPALAPSLAARREHQRVRAAAVLAHIRALQNRFDVLLIEGAGGLLSPLGEDFNSRDLIAVLDATPMIVCPNRLGAVNQVLLTLEALPTRTRTRARVVLVSPPKPDAASRSNRALLAELFDGKRIFQMPWLAGRSALSRGLKDLRMRKVIKELAAAL